MSASRSNWIPNGNLQILSIFGTLHPELEHWRNGPGAGVPHVLGQILLFIALTIAASPGIGASFDCARATTRIEKLVCSNDELSRLDETLARVYKSNLLGQTDYDQVLQSRQRSWLIRVRDGCMDTDCLKSTYIARIEGLKSYGLCYDLADSTADDGSDFDECRYFPGHPDKLVSATLVAPSAKNSNDASLDLSIKVFDRKSKEIIAQLVSKGFGGLGDRPLVAVYSVSFFVSRQVQTVGITYEWRALANGGRSSASGRTLSLYALSGKTLNPVLEKLDMGFSSGGTEGDGQCSEYSNEKKVSLAILPAVRNGYNDLQLSTTETGQHDELRSGKCFSIPDKPVRKRYELKFSGKSYVVPKE